MTGLRRVGLCRRRFAARRLDLLAEASVDDLAFAFASLIGPIM